MDTNPSYTAIDHGQGTDLFVYTDSQRKVIGHFVNGGGRVDIVRALYSQGLPAAIKEAVRQKIEWIAE